MRFENPDCNKKWYNQPMKYNIKNKNTKWALVILASLVFIIAIPLPLKPSLWTFLHRQRLNATLSTFTEPLYVTDQTEQSDFGFQTYLGWKNSYWVRGFAKNSDHSGGYYYIQASKTGLFGESDEGPSAFDMAPIKQAFEQTCKPHISGIEICEVLEPKQYVAKYQVQEAYLLSDITQKVFNKDKLDPAKYPYPHDYIAPTEDQIQYIADVMLKAKPKPIADVKKHFKPEF